MINEQSTNMTPTFRHRAVTKILSCQVYAVSKQGIEQAGCSFGSILLFFSYETSQGSCSDIAVRENPKSQDLSDSPADIIYNKS